MVLDSEKFANQITRRTEKEAERAVELFPGVSPDVRLEGEELIDFMRFWMWGEFHFGCYPPVIQMHQLFQMHDGNVEEILDFSQELVNMIRDELKHSKMFQNRIEELGAEPDLGAYDPSVTPSVLELCEHTFNQPHPACVAAAQQLGGEEFVVPFYQAMIDYDVVDERTQEMLHTQTLDEPNHHNIGRKILVRYATDEETQRRALEANKKANELMYKHFGLEYKPMDV